MNRLLALVKWLVWTKQRPLWLSHMDTIFYKLLLGPETCKTRCLLSPGHTRHQNRKKTKSFIVWLRLLMVALRTARRRDRRVRGRHEH